MSCQLDSSETRKAKLKQNIRRGTGTLIPFIRWILSYSRIDAVADFITGITIGLIIIPQSVAYVTIIGLSAKVGLLSSVVGGIIYACLGTIKEISIGPSATMSLLTNEYISGHPIESIGFLSFGCAIVGLVLSVLRLGLIVEFISVPVSSAFGTAVAISILASELKNFCGLNYKSNQFTESLEKFHGHIQEIKVGDLSLGITSTVILVLLGKLKDLPISRSCPHRDVLKRSLWFMSTSRNAITLFLACLLTKYFELYHGAVPYMLSDPVTPGSMTFQPPWTESKSGNGTETVSDKIRSLYSGMIVIPIVSLLVHVSIAKFFDSGYTIGVSHELFSNSLSNFLCSFFNSSPIAGAFSRSAVSSTCQVKTPLSNLYAAGMAFLALTYLTPYFRLIPKASLSAVIVTAVIFVIDYKIVKPLWKSSKKDLFVLCMTLVVALYYGVEIGLVIGVACNLMFLLYLWARPSIVIEKCKSEYGDYVMVTPDLGLFFPAVGYMEMEMNKTLKKYPYRNLPIAVNCIFFKGFDYTAVKGLTRIIKVYQKQKRNIVFFNANQKLSDMCRDVDASVSAYFCDNDENYKHMLFGDNRELNEVKIKELAKDNTKGINGNCSGVLPDRLPKEEVPLLNIIRKQNRPNSL